MYAEAGGQNYTTKRAVAHVINNRVGTTKKRVNIEAVLSEPGQFNGYGNANYLYAMEYYNTGKCDNAINKKSLDECLAVVIPIYYNEDEDITGGALYFHSFTNPEQWRYHNSYTLVDVPGTEKFWFYK